MSIIHRMALVNAAHNHVALEGSLSESLALYFMLKAQSETNPETQVGQLTYIGIPSEYELKTVLELVEMIQHEAANMLSFSNHVLNAAHQGLLDAIEAPGFEMDATRWSFESFAEGKLASEHGSDTQEVFDANDLMAKLSSLHPEKQWSLYPIGDYCQYAEADAPDVLVSFECDEQELDSGLVDPYSTMLGGLCEPAAWGLSDEAAKLMKAFNKVNMAKYQNADGPKFVKD